MHRHEAAQLGFYLLNHHGRAGGDNSYARCVRPIVNLGHGQAVNIEAAPRKQADNARQHAGFIIHQHRNGMGINLVLRGHFSSHGLGIYAEPFIT